MKGFALACVDFLAAPVWAQSARAAAETASVRNRIAACWSVTEAAEVVTLRFSLDRDGQRDAESIRLMQQGDGARAAVEHAFKAAKRAVLRCGQTGYSLPVEKYEQWRDIELTFDLERTILR